MRPTIKRVVISAFLLLALVLPVLAACGSVQRDSGRSEAVPEDLATVWQTYRALQERYVGGDTLDPEKLSAAAIRGMLESLDDPFASYFDAGNFRSSLDDIEGTFEGIGATVTMRDGYPTIVAPLPDSPADKAGLNAGDVIRGVEGESIDGLTLQEVVGMIRGPSGTPIRISIQPEGTGVITEVTIFRAEILLASVSSEILSDGIARVRITKFVSKTSSELEQVLKELEERNVEGIVLDLRNNPGGLVTAVVEVASQFLDGGMLGYQINASGKRTDWNVEGGGRVIDQPIVVLVNRGSASGSEVVAGAIQSRERGEIIGTRTFGKGVVNISIQLDDGSGLHIPTATWFTPTGKQIGQVGLTPDIEVVPTLREVEAGRDPQLDKALEILREAVGAPSLTRAS